MSSGVADKNLPYGVRGERHGGCLGGTTRIVHPWTCENGRVLLISMISVDFVDKTDLFVPLVARHDKDNTAIGAIMQEESRMRIFRVPSPLGDWYGQRVYSESKRKRKYASQ